MMIIALITTYVAWAAVMAVFVVRMLKSLNPLQPWRKHFRAQYPDYAALIVRANRKANEMIIILLASIPIMAAVIWGIGRVF